MARMPAIVVSELSKSYKYHLKEPGLAGSLKSLLRRRTQERQAVKGIRFSIDPGEVVGFLGPNGAGKTTTLKMLCGLLQPSSGTASILGYTPAHRKADFLRRISLVMGQKTMLSWEIPAMDTLLLHKEMYRIPSNIFRDNVDELAKMLQVTQLLNVQVRKLSLGERMKMEILAALVHQPEILFLDEPTIGLDVVSQQRVREFLRALNRERHTTILLTSHYMDDIEQLCPRVLVIDSGAIRFDGQLTDLIRTLEPCKQLSAVLAEPLSAPAFASVVESCPLLSNEDPLRITVSVPREQIAEVANRLFRVGQVLDIAIEEVPIEDIIRSIFASHLERSS